MGARGLLPPVAARGETRPEWPIPTDEYVRALFGAPGVTTAALTGEIMFASTALPGSFRADPADRIFVETAARYDACLLTRDARILAFAKETGYLRCIAC